MNNKRKKIERQRCQDNGIIGSDEVMEFIDAIERCGIQTYDFLGSCVIFSGPDCRGIALDYFLTDAEKGRNA